MKPVKTFRVIPKLPENIEKLRTIAHNLCWCWDYEAVSLFRRMDSDLWDHLDHNPVRMLGALTQERLDELARDDGFIDNYHRVTERMAHYLKEAKWYEKQFGKKDMCIAYFSVEFGITESLPIYSGGSVSLREITSNQRQISVCRLSASGCSIKRAISGSASTMTDGRRNITQSMIFIILP